MKKLILIIIIIILAVGAFKLFGKDSPSSKIPKNASEGFIQVNNALNEYEAIIETYENQGGIKTPQDMLKFSSEIQAKFPTYSPSSMSTEEAQMIGERLNELRSRQMKLLNASR